MALGAFFYLVLLGAVLVPLNSQLKALPWGGAVLAAEAGGVQRPRGTPGVKPMEARGQAGPRADSGPDHGPKGYV